jgi:hypothetical protein
VDISGWKNGVDAIYGHVKQGDNLYALMQFAFEYNNDESNEDVGRVHKFYYHFVLYEQKNPVGSIMEGQIDNVYPHKE